MTELTIFEENGQLLTDSREVAVLVGKNHKELLRDIRNYMDYLIESNFALKDFFIESTYRDSINRTLPCYLITKKGCDMIANKLTGRKGILFTAAYVEGFYKMQEFIEKGQTIGDNVPFTGYVKSVEIVADMLKYNDVSKVAMLHKAYESYNLPTEFLPSYVEGRVKYSATTLLEKNNVPYKAVAFNKRMEKAGLLEHKERKSTTKGIKKFWSLTEAGMEFGENQVSPNNPRETQPLYYEDMFPKLLGILSHSDGTESPAS